MNSVFVVQTVDTSTCNHADTFQDLNRVLRHVDEQMYAHQALLSPKTVLFKVMQDNLTSSNKYLPLKLLCQTIVSNLQHAFTFKYVYRGSSFQGVTVKTNDGVMLRGDCTFANSVQAAWSLHLLLDSIHAAFAKLQRYIEQSPPELNEMASEYAVLQKTFSELTAYYLPDFLKSKVEEYNYLLHNVSLTTFPDTINSLNGFLHDLLQGCQFHFSTIAVAYNLYRSDLASLGLSKSQQNTWFHCVESLLPPASNLDATIEVLYNYMIGYFISHGICNQLKGSFGSMLNKLQTTSNETHRRLFVNIHSALKQLCQGSTFANHTNTAECQTRLQKSKAIMNELARLFKLLQTWEAPEEQEWFFEVPEEALNLLSKLKQFEEEYWIKHTSLTGGFFQRKGHLKSTLLY